MKSKIFIISFIVMPIFVGISQPKVINNRQIFWPHYFSRFEYGKLTFLADGSKRFEQNNAYQLIMRAGLAYQLSSNFELAAGFAYSEIYGVGKATRKERRPWKQITYRTKFNKLNFQARFRLEQRYNFDNKTDKYNYSNERFRFQIQFQYPIWSKNNKQVSGVLAEEIMLNQGKNVNTFDQNRIIAGIQYQWKKGNHILISYQNMYQQTRTKNTFDDFDILRILVVNTFKLKKNDK